MQLPSGWTSRKLQGLKEGLSIVKQKGGYWPDEESLRLAHGCYSAWAAELVIMRGEWPNREVLLAVYDGAAEFFSGKWQLPGGYHRKSERSLQETCSAIAKRELNIDVRYLRTLDVYLWEAAEHPYGTPLSVYFEVAPLGPITETSKVQFFLTSSLPDNIVSPHRRFVEQLTKGGVNLRQLTASDSAT